MPLTFNAIFYHAGSSRSFERMRLLLGSKVGSLHKPDHDQILAATATNVSMPTSVFLCTGVVLGTVDLHAA